MPAMVNRLAATSAVGVDIGSSGIRAAEVRRVRTRRGLALVRSAQVELPRGAVVDGEINDQAAVVSVLRQLWAEGGFSSRNVVLALSGRRVIVRQAEVPSMSESDFRSALTFQAMDLIPFPVDEVRLDFVILPPATDGPKPDDRMQVLLAVAHRDVIDSHLDVLREASLHPVALDPAPMAAVRATLRISEDPAATVAVVDLGADLTLITVRDAGRVRFSRLLDTGGGDLSNRLAKRRPAPPDPGGYAARTLGQGAAGSLLTGELDPLASQIESTLAFFSDQMGADPIHDILVTGRGSQSTEILGHLAARLPGRVFALDALAGLDSRSLDLGADARSSASSSALLAVGAAEWIFEDPTRRLSLLPPELARSAALRRRVGVASAAAVLLAGGLAGLTVQRADHTTKVRTQVEAVRAANVATEIRVAQLAPLSEALSALTTRLTQVAADQADDIAWSPFLAEVTRALPAGLHLTSLSVADAHGASAAADGGAAAGATLGSVTMSVSGLGGEEQVAVWLRAFAHLPGLTAVWVPGASVSGGTVTFTSTGTLTAGVPLQDRTTAGGSSS